MKKKRSKKQAELQRPHWGGSYCRREGAIEYGLVGRKQNGYRLIPMLAPILLRSLGLQQVGLRGAGNKMPTG